MKQYLTMLQQILEEGEVRGDRTGTGTIGIFGYQSRYDLSEGFPLSTTKEMALRLIFEELKWFLKGETNIYPLLQKNVNIWNKDAYRWYLQQHPDCTMTLKEFIQAIKDGQTELGELGPVYGKQWRSWEGANGETVDQLMKAMDSIKNDPYSRRHIVLAWNPAQTEQVALPSCHALFQLYVSNEGRLSCQMYQRSMDSFLGGFFNVASYALLVHMIAHVLDLTVGDFIHTCGDAHIYLNHVEQTKEQLSRTPRALPQLRITRKVDSLLDIEWEDIELIGYDPHPPIVADVSVGLSSVRSNSDRCD